MGSGYIRYQRHRNRWIVELDFGTNYGVRDAISRYFIEEHDFERIAPTNPEFKIRKVLGASPSPPMHDDVENGEIVKKEWPTDYKELYDLRRNIRRKTTSVDKIIPLWREGKWRAPSGYYLDGFLETPFDGYNLRITIQFGPEYQNRIYALAEYSTGIGRVFNAALLFRDNGPGTPLLRYFDEYSTKPDATFEPQVVDYRLTLPFDWQTAQEFATEMVMSLPSPPEIVEYIESKKKQPLKPLRRNIRRKQISDKSKPWFEEFRWWQSESMDGYEVRGERKWSDQHSNPIERVVISLDGSYDDEGRERPEWDSVERIEGDGSFVIAFYGSFSQKYAIEWTDHWTEIKDYAGGAGGEYYHYRTKFKGKIDEIRATLMPNDPDKILKNHVDKGGWGRNPIRRNIRRKTVEEKDIFDIAAFTEPKILPVGYDWEARTTYDITNCEIMPPKAGKTMLQIQVSNQETRQAHAFSSWGMTTPTARPGIGMQRVESTWEFSVDTEFRVKRPRKRGKGPDVDATKMTGDKWRQIVECLKSKPDFPPSLTMAMEKAIDDKLASDPQLSWRRWKTLEFSIEHEEAMLTNGWEKFVKKYGFPLRRN